MVRGENGLVGSTTCWAVTRKTRRIILEDVRYPNGNEFIPETHYLSGVFNEIDRGTYYFRIKSKDDNRNVY